MRIAATLLTLLLPLLAHGRPQELERVGDDLYFQGEKVKSISSIDDNGMKEVINIEELLKKEEVEGMQEVKSLEEVANMSEVKSMEPVSSMDEVKNIQPVKNIDEVLNIDNIKRKYKIDDDLARRFIKKEGLKSRSPSYARGQIDEGPSMGMDEDVSDLYSSISTKEEEIDKLKKRLEDTLGEIKSINQLLKKLEVTHLEEVQSMRELKTVEEIEKMEEIRNMEEVEKINEVLKKEELLEKQLVRSMKPVKRMEEVVNKWPLTKAQARELVRRIKKSRHRY